MVPDKTWMAKDKSTKEWQDGMKAFLDFAFRGAHSRATIPCPCTICRNICHKTRKEVHIDLLQKGMLLDYTLWTHHGEKAVPISAVNQSTIDEGSTSREVTPTNVVEQSSNTEGSTRDDDAMCSMLNHIIRGTNIEHNNSTDDGDEEGTATEEPGGCAKAFFDLLKDAKKDLYPGCEEATKLSFIVRLYQIKCLHGLSNKACEAILDLFSYVLPKGHCIPNTLEKLQKVVRDLGLDYQKIDACKNDCVLFWKDYSELDKCPNCGESRWKSSESGDQGDVAPCGRAKKLVPQKILRYFPLTPRLQRLYMAEPTASHMRWHKEERVDDGIMRHPADSKAWKHFDALHPHFASDPRSVRLGLASDGFNPFGLMNVSYSTWPVILIPYNLPPWLCMKQPYWILSMLIPGPKSPGNNIDVYLQPLIAELHELWTVGAKTYDASTNKSFRMHVSLLWTINDFPAYAILSGWSTKGRLACPYCHISTEYLWLKFGCKHCYMGHRRFLHRRHRWRRNKASFNNKPEHRDAPKPLSGEDVLQQYNSFDQIKFGPSKKRKRDDAHRWHNWKKKSIFFQLPYWKTLLVRHNLDVMHIEKNICESILGTLLEMDSKSKDSLKARLDMEQMGIRTDQHPVVENDKYKMPAALYALSKDDKAALCKFLEDVKMPDGYCSNIKRCVDVTGCKVSGMKTHDCHVIFQKLLPIAIRKLLPEDIVVPLIELSNFFAEICSRELSTDDLYRLGEKIPEILCRLEMIFPPAFFDIMVHLPVHLAEEASLGGPVLYRWMYPIERYLRTLKSYVRNKAHPEGSIAEGYIYEECLAFCSQFVHNIDTKLNRPERHESTVRNEPPTGSSIFSKVDHSKKGFKFEVLTRAELKKIMFYIISNYDEATPWINEHIEELKGVHQHNIDKHHKEEFIDWFQERIRTSYKEGKVSDDIYALSRGPDHRARIYSRCTVNGFLFRTAHVERDLRTQNSGVAVKGDESTSNSDWYGVIKKIFCLDFGKDQEVLLFECDWFDVSSPSRKQSRGCTKDKYGMIDVDTTILRYKDQPYILGTQAEQVFYVRDVKKPNWATVVRTKPRNLFAMPSTVNEETMIEADIDSIDVGYDATNIPHINEDTSAWTRHGIEGASGDVSTLEQARANLIEEDGFASEDEDDEDDDTYINDGHVAPVTTTGDEDDDDFFI